MKEFHEGQKVRIIANTCGHFHDIGEVVTLTKAFLLNDKTNYWSLESDDWDFDSDDCELINE
jgi:hypothetical protein